MTIQFTPYLMMDGNTKKVIRFYENALDAKILSIQTYGEMDSSCPTAIKEHVAHAMLKSGEAVLMFSDTPGLPIQKGNQVKICISTNDVEKSRRIFEALQQDGQVNSPLEVTPFSPAYGNVTDKFGVAFTIVGD